MTSEDEFQYRQEEEGRSQEVKEGMGVKWKLWMKAVYTSIQFEGYRSFKGPYNKRNILF